MRRLASGLISLFLMCGSCAFAQSNDPVAVHSTFPTAGYLQFPPHFQPRPANTVDKVSAKPPPIPSYAQPAMPEDGYFWMPGFWAWRKDVLDYYWVPGTWVKPPRIGLLWTPPYWSRSDEGYLFHGGYWADAVGFYGGIDYGYGYSGDGYRGGRWDNGIFFYNSAANNFGSLNIAHSYNHAIASEDNSVRLSFNGGHSGTKARPTPDQEDLARAAHVAPTDAQLRHFEMAARDRSLYSKLNGDQPGIAATTRAGVFDSRSVTRSSERATANAPGSTGANVK